MLDVLVFTPVYRLETETVSSLFSLEWDGPLSFLLQRDNPFQRGTGGNDGPTNHYYQYVKGRDFFLRGDYDAMLIIESDIIVPPDALRRLAALEADVAYGCYLFRNQMCPVVNVAERYPDKNGRPARNTGESLTVRGKWRQARRQGVVACSGGGFGCVLVKRHVIEAIPLRLEENGYCDTPWTTDAYRAGYRMVADTGVLCGHIDEDGAVLWPS